MDIYFGVETPHAALIAKNNKLRLYNVNSDYSEEIECPGLTGEWVKIVSHVLQIVMLSEKEISVYDPLLKKNLQIFTDLPEFEGRFTAIGSSKDRVFIGYTSNAKNKKIAKSSIHILEKISFERQLDHILGTGDIEYAQKLFMINYRGSRNKNALDEEKKKFNTKVGWILFF